MKEKNENIQMRLASVHEVSFMMSPARIGEEVNLDSLQVGFSSQVEPDVENDRFVLILSTRYELEGNGLESDESEGEIVLESVCRFVFEVRNLRRLVTFNEDGSVTINDIMPLLLSVAVGTMRGILVVKTAGTRLAERPLPMIDIDELTDRL